MSTTKIYDDVLAQVDILDGFKKLFPEYKVTKKGVHFFSCCPFHNEKTPSFAITPSKGFAACQSCRQGGNVIHLAMKRDNIGYREAAELVADEFSIPYEKKELTPEQKEKETLANEITHANMFASVLFSKNLEAVEAQTYVKDKLWSDSEIIEKFNIGYAKDDFSELHKYLYNNKIDNSIIEASTLCKKSEKNGKLYDYFRNRIIFPIHNHIGRIVGFGGRTLSTDKEQPKYLNTPATALYEKSKVLYGLYQGLKAIRSTKVAYLVEGYTDVIALHKIGIDNAVASCGTAFTKDQAKLLRRYADTVVILRDGDAGGEGAAVSDLPILLEAGLNAEIVKLPDGEDPYSFFSALPQFNEYMASHKKDAILEAATGAFKEATSPMANTIAVKYVCDLLSNLDKISKTFYATALSKITDISKTQWNGYINNTEPSEPEEEKKDEFFKPRKNKKWLVLDEIIKDWKLKFRLNTRTRVLDYSRNGMPYEQLNTLPNDIVKEMETNRGVSSISMTKVKEMLGSSDIVQIYDPVAKFFEKLPKWDGKDRVLELMNCIEIAEIEKRDYFNSMFTKHMIRTIRCALQPQYTNRMVFTLHGKQEIGKTKIFEWIFPHDLYSEEAIVMSDKDSLLSISKYLCINLDEVDSMTRGEANKIKAFISKGKVTKRVAYGHFEEHFERIASFVASTNEYSLLSDSSNTRWVVCSVTGFDWQNYTKNIDRLQLWAQWYAMYNENNEAGDLTVEEKRERDQRNNTHFVEISKELELINKYFNLSDSNYMTATDVEVLLKRNFGSVNLSTKRIATELKRKFGEPLHTTVVGKSGRYYPIADCLPRIDTAQIATEAVKELVAETSDGEEIPF